jgi:hypothetical protein
MHPCLNNYEIVAGKVIEIYLRNSNSVQTKNSTIKTFFNDTPFTLYSAQMNPGSIVDGSDSSKQVQMFIIILSLLAVSMSRVNSSEFVVNVDNGVVDLAGFSSLITAAGMLNKPVVLWNDDMRSTWGVTNDPMTVGSVPNFFRNLYGVPSSQSQFQPWLKNLANSENPPHMGKNVPCPPGNIFDVMIPEAMKSVVSGAKVDLNNTYFSTLISLGDKLIDYVENKEDFPGWDTSKNPGLFYDLYWIIWQNLDILTPIQQNFINSDNGNPFNQSSKSQMEFFTDSQKYQALLRKHIGNNSQKINIQQVIKSIENGGC